MKNVLLTSDEIKIISSTAKDRKFNMKSTDLYHNNSVDIIKIFVKCYQFLLSLSEGMKEDNSIISEKIENFLKDYKDIFDKSFELVNDLNRESNYGKSKTTHKINNICNQNKEDILEMISIVFPIGRMVREYSPDEAIGV